MAQVMLTVCDKCKDDGETVKQREFAVDGALTTPDLCGSCYQEFLTVVAPWFELVRVTGKSVPVINERGGSTSQASAAKPSGISKDERAAVRAYAASKGTTLRESGRLSPTWIEQWRDAGSPMSTDLNKESA